MVGSGVKLRPGRLPRHALGRPGRIGQVRLFRSAEERAAGDAAEAEFKAFVALLPAAPPSEVEAAASRLKQSAVLEALPRRKRRSLAETAFRTYAETVLADDLLTLGEEQAFYDVSEAVGIDDDALATEHRDLLYRLAIAQANDGRLGTIEQPKLLSKKGEIVHLEMLAALMKEVTLREFRGGSQGMSFPIMKGVRYRVGGFRGRSVVVGTQLQVRADAGVLSVTSKRVVFLGERKTMEMPYSKLVGLEVFSDAVRVNASNRQNAPLFRLDSGEVVAATINAAMQRIQ